MKVRIPGRQTLKGKIAAPGSKPYTHRALLASLLSKGETTILVPSKCDDTQRTLKGIQALGADVVVEYDRILSQGIGEISPRLNTNIHCGDSGTTLRLLTAVAATSSTWIRLNASPSLARRPMAPLLESLSELGASTSIGEDSQGSEIRVKGPLKGGETWIKGNVSSQFISGLLFAAPLAKSDVTIHVIDRLQSRPYVELSLEILRRHGIRTERSNDGYFVPSLQEYRPASHRVPGDFSSASFLLAGAGIAGDEVTITGVNGYDYEPDKAIVKLLCEIGAEPKSNGDALTVKRTELRPFKFDASDNPDLVPPLQVIASFANGESEITGVDRLRFKETNRVETVPAELQKMGANIMIDNDRIRIQGASELRGSVLDSRGDHRVAMACSIAALAAEGESDLYHAEAVSKSYPEFFRDLTTLGVQLYVE
jgi:3-phosphoshikimate 1-carboxyvinyltransferase